jgi:hypothetical protein
MRLVVNRNVVMRRIPVYGWPEVNCANSLIGVWLWLVLSDHQYHQIIIHTN